MSNNFITITVIIIIMIILIIIIILICFVRDCRFFPTDAFTADPNFFKLRDANVTVQVQKENVEGADATDGEKEPKAIEYLCTFRNDNAVALFTTRTHLQVFFRRTPPGKVFRICLMMI
jgi:hypothetical protein